ncbi:hypothetical protein HMPREF9444_02148 [Succinatimonas hippei YIT 12066]|uniref:Uncharacterized protein n=1 Tax=Succinatimonas hippei (strain DSM 22608 / JCM 16073 / KCTC 15190 / YIT 12066) TaxID=762983 RepID=E8LMZ5_SUCHY|nr:hypothetical protein HMPREF9444_02148 [Succinatimonas hippei YIT 12066]
MQLKIYNSNFILAINCTVYITSDCRLGVKVFCILQTGKYQAWILPYVLIY